MNYRHVFHAGNFADVFKHVALSLLLRALHKKETPFCYFDTHAGAGRYDLASVPAQKSGEYRNGIARLWEAVPLPPALMDYVDAVRTINPDGQLRFYPGSPLLAQGLLRPQDRMVLCERHPEQCAQLKAQFAGERRATVHERDGYEALKALLPPKERRGLVLIDPPFEQANEYEQIVGGLDAAHQRWPTGIYVVWYPIKDRAGPARFHELLGRTAWPKILNAEFIVFPPDTAFRLNGCGLTVINPPWGFDEALGKVFGVLTERLAAERATGGSVRWLVQ